MSLYLRFVQEQLHLKTYAIEHLPELLADILTAPVPPIRRWPAAVYRQPTVVLQRKMIY